MKLIAWLSNSVILALFLVRHAAPRPRIVLQWENHPLYRRIRARGRLRRLYPHHCAPLWQTCPRKSHHPCGEYDRSRRHDCSQLYLQPGQAGRSDHRSFRRHIDLAACVGQRSGKIRRTQIRLARRAYRRSRRLRSDQSQRISTLDGWLTAKEAVKMGGHGPGGVTSDTARILRDALGLPLRVIDGYKCPGPIRLAAESRRSLRRVLGLGVYETDLVSGP